MSGTLVSGNGVPNFAQQGSVDWVALSNSSVQFSVAVLARLSRAGIDAFTLQFGRAICSNFSLEPHAQERIYDAIVKLKKYGSYKDIIWFGFGIKDVVTDLADSEEGLTLVALCAALATTYDSMYAATVIRELCVLCKAPQSFTPAIRQWKTLVDLCSGIFANAHFTLVANGFRQLISGHSNHLVARHTPTTHSALAKAILMLAKVSKGNLFNATFSGGIDCAWLAAFAEWLLLLKVAIYDSNGSLLYHSGDAAHNPPQVTIVLPTTAGNTIQEILIKSKASFIPSGQSLLQKDPALRGVNLLNWHGSWSTILHEVFYSNIDDLLSGETGQYFNMYMYCVSLLARPENAAGQRGARYVQSGEPCFRNHPVNPLILIQNDSRGQAFMKFAARRLPEIAACLLTTTWNDSTTSVDGLLAIRSIEGVCRCAFHSQSNQKKVEEDDLVCLQTMAETIAIYLWILVDSDIDEDVPPSITGLANLYTWQSRANKSSALASREFYKPIMNCDFPVLGIDLVMHVLSGLAIPGHPPKHESLPTNDNLARVGNGICVYHRAVEDPNLLPETMFRFRVVRGYISFSGFRYNEICGFRHADNYSRLSPWDLRSEGPISSVDAIVQETENERRLEMAYLIRYFKTTSQIATHWLHLPYIFRKLQRRVGYLNCAGNCPALYDVGILDYVPQYPWKPSKSLLARKEDYDRTQQMLSGLKHAGDSWILLSSPGSFTIITSKPILLYALIDRSTLSLLPFKDCLGCIMHAGQDVREFYYQEVDVVELGSKCVRQQTCSAARFLTLDPFSETTISLERPP